MPKIKRTKYFFVRFQDGQFLDIELLLRGTAKLSAVTQIYAASILREREYLLTEAEFELLTHVPSDQWMSTSYVLDKFGVDSKLIDTLAHKGLLVSDKADKQLEKLRRRDEKLSSSKWNIYATLYHFMTKWEDLQLKISFPGNAQEGGELGVAEEEAVKEFVARHGHPPSHFHEIRHVRSVCELPLVRKNDRLYEILLKRKTTREFDGKEPMRIEDLSALLYYVYGCHGYVSIFEEDGQEIVGLKKTSPSGGDLHPIEVYPLIINAADLDPGLYHYNVKNHSLETIENMQRSEARELSNKFTVGQSFPRSAQALFVMTARFYRNFWKYRNHPRTYAVLLMDAAHLSQTFYLVCTELGLGAFFTAAINHINIEKKLQLDGFEEGAVGICGCGRVLEEGIGLDPKFYPYVPRKTAI